MLKGAERFARADFLAVKKECRRGIDTELVALGFVSVDEVVDGIAGVIFVELRYVEPQLFGVGVKIRRRIAGANPAGGRLAAIVVIIILLIQQVVHLPEFILQPGGFGCPSAGKSIGVQAGQRKVAELKIYLLAVLRQHLLQNREILAAVWTLVITVLDERDVVFALAFDVVGGRIGGARLTATVIGLAAEGDDADEDEDDDGQNGHELLGHWDFLSTQLLRPVYRISDANVLKFFSPGSASIRSALIFCRFATRRTTLF